MLPKPIDWGTGTRALVACKKKKKYRKTCGTFTGPPQDVTADNNESAPRAFFEITFPRGGKAVLSA